MVAFIFMLTRDDRTIDDVLAVHETLRPLGLTDVGFKDIGVATPILAELHRRLRADGVTTWLEVVSTTPQACRRSAEVAAELGVDRLMGGTDIPAMLEILRGTGIAYLPFVGRPRGHPTRLGGDSALVRDQARQAMDQGCAGVDLLAWRATEADPVDLIHAARAGLGVEGELVIAGSIDAPARIRTIIQAGANGFTVGSAAFNGQFESDQDGLAGQIAAIQAALQV